MGHPISTRLLVRPHQAVKEVGGIVIPDRALDRPITGDIVEVGDEVHAVLRPGRVAIFQEKAGTDLTFDGVQYFLVDQREVLAWLE